MDKSGRERTREIAVAEVRFAIEFGSLNERFWRRIDSGLNFTTIAFGALALTGAMQSQPWLSASSGIVLAIVSALQIGLQPFKRSVDFRDAKRAFHDLNARSPSLDLADIDAELERLRRDAPQGVDALSMPALNIVNQRHGHGPARTLRFGERVAIALA